MIIDRFIVKSVCWSACFNLPHQFMYPPPKSFIVHLSRMPFTFIPLRWVLFDVGEVDVCIVAPGSPPRDVRARPVSSSTVVVQWNEPEIPNGVVRVRKPYHYCHTKPGVTF